MTAVAVLAGIGYHTLGGGLDDGAYLQLSFSDQLLAGESFRVNVDDPSSDATANPLLVGLLSAGRLIFGGEAGARVLGVVILVGFGLCAFWLAANLGAEPIIACIAGLAVALSPSVVTASSSLQPIAFDALLLVIAVIGVLRGIGTLALAAGALTLTSYPGMFAGLAFALAVPAIDAVKRKQLEKRYLLLLIPFALAAARAISGPILFESNPLREVLAPLALSGAPAMEQRLTLLAALPIRIFTLLGVSTVGFLMSAAAFSLAVPKLRWRTSLAAIVISVAVTYLVMRGTELMVLWAAPLVVVAGVTWCGSYWKEHKKVRLWVTVGVALAFVAPPLLTFPQSGIEGGVLDLCRRVPEILPPRTVIATSHPGAYRCIADVPVVDLSGALPPKICEGPRDLAVVLESWAHRVRVRRPTYVVSDGVNIAEVRSTPLLERVFPENDGPDALWRIDWEPLDRREGLWNPGVLERIGDGRLINWLDIGGGGESAGIVNLETYGAANLDWKLVWLPVELWGRSTTLADTCRVCRNAEAVRVDVLLPPHTRVVCLRLFVCGAGEPECRAESGAYST
ncbi:MAG TPA: hypothetical protein VM054_01175, partial [bacterium]|nr:hypothetical protein [bacterium]